MNHIIIKGRLTRDPELRTVGSQNITCCSASVAVNRAMSKENEADFFDCTFWRKTAELVAEHFRKGQEILVSGEMQMRRYEDKDGNHRTAWTLNADRVEFCGSRADNDSGPDAPTKKTAAKPKPAATSDGDDEDLPF